MPLSPAETLPQVHPHTYIYVWLGTLRKRRAKTWGAYAGVSKLYRVVKGGT